MIGLQKEPHTEFARTIPLVVVGALVGAVVGWILAPVPRGYSDSVCANGPLLRPAGCDDYYGAKNTGALGVGIAGSALGLVAGLVLTQVGRTNNAQYSPTPSQMRNQTPQVAQNVASPTAQQSGVNCTHCGADNSSANKLCGKCGQSLTPPPAEKHCTRCGAINAPEYRFCGDCGTPLTVPQMKPTS
jgi:ribosomal protein L40E